MTIFTASSFLLNSSTRTVDLIFTTSTSSDPRTYLGWKGSNNLNDSFGIYRLVGTKKKIVIVRIGPVSILAVGVFFFKMMIFRILRSSRTVVFFMCWCAFVF